MDNRNLDLYNTESNNILSERKQSETKDVINKLKQFKPTKIALEVANEEEKQMNTEYQKYVKNKLDLKTNEKHQIGFRVAKELGHNKVHAIDWNKWEEKDNNISLGDVLNYAEINQNNIYEKLTTYWNEIHYSQQKMLENNTIEEFLCELNRCENVERMHQSYLELMNIGMKGDYIGIRWLKWWYQRNLIIVSNLNNIIESNEERVLLIYGASHVHLLSQFIKESGKYELESITNYLS